MALDEQGRTIYQRILTWTINKISRTILKAAYVAIAFVVTGKFVVSTFAMLLAFMTDFAKISLATDHVRPSKKPETWNIGGFTAVSVALGIAMVAETLFLLWIGWSHFGLATNNNGLYTFSFLTLRTLSFSPSCQRGSGTGSGSHCPARPFCQPSRPMRSWKLFDARGSTGTHAVALVADSCYFRLCDSLVPCRE